MSSKHTPGPWQVDKTAHGEAGISILYTDRSDESNGWVKWEMARVGLNSRKVTPETEANARLISAAPDLFVAAENACAALRIAAKNTADTFIKHDCERAMAALISAIAKAEGGDK